MGIESSNGHCLKLPRILTAVPTLCRGCPDRWSRCSRCCRILDRPSVPDPSCRHLSRHRKNFVADSEQRGNLITGYSGNDGREKVFIQQTPHVKNLDAENSTGERGTEDCANPALRPQMAIFFPVVVVKFEQIGHERGEGCACLRCCASF